MMVMSSSGVGSFGSASDLPNSVSVAALYFALLSTVLSSVMTETGLWPVTAAGVDLTLQEKLMASGESLIVL